ncbi:MAG: hypothetical protein N2045_04590 [Fimbriimonadales bacterium]|nr:hypothetical protein [Fimbriimonadales bacterium]
MRRDDRGVFWCATPMHGVSRFQRGSVYVIALLTLVVLGTLASVLGWSALVQAQRAQQRETRLRLESLCQSGITYASWARRVQKRPLPFTETLNLSEGRVVVRAQPANRYGRNAFQVISTATYKDQTLTRTRILDGNSQPRTTTEFALYLDKGITVGAGQDITVKGDAHSNHLIKVMSGGRLYVDGSLTSRLNMLGSPTATLYREEFSGAVPFDIPDISLLRLRATQLITGDLNLPFGLSLPDGAIYYVAGNLSIEGTLRGRATVVVEGNLTFTDETKYADEDSLFIFIVNGDIVLPDDERIVGVLVSQNGSVIADDESEVYGGIILLNGSLIVSDEFTVEHDPRINADLFRDIVGGALLTPVPTP